MKKPKRPFELEEDKGSPNVIGIDLGDGLDDEEIIDLDDVVDLDEELIEDGDQFDLDVELLDADPDLNLNDMNETLSVGADDPLEDDILKEFSLTDEDTEGSGEDHELDFGEDSDADKLGSLLRFDEDTSIEDEREAESLFSEKARISGSEDTPETPGLAGETVDEVITQMEARLVRTIREIVESRLPDIVRSVLQEEIQRLKEELK